MMEIHIFQELVNCFNIHLWYRIGLLINILGMRSGVVYQFMLFAFAILVTDCAYWCQASAKYTSDHTDNKPLVDIAYNPVNGKVASVNSGFQNVNIYNADLTLIQKYSEANNPLCVLYHNDGVRLFIGYSNGDVRTLQTSPSVAVLTGQTHVTGHTKVNQIDANVDYTKFVTCGGTDFTFKVWSNNWSTSISGPAVTAQIKTCKFAYDDTHADSVIIGYGTKTAVYELISGVYTLLETHTFSGTVNQLSVRKGSYVHVVGHTGGLDVTNYTGGQLKTSNSRMACYSDTTHFLVGSVGVNAYFYDAQFQQNLYLKSQEVPGFSGGDNGYACLFTPDGDKILLGDQLGDLYYFSRTCTCAVNQYQNSGSCTACSTPMPGCTQCISSTSCYECSANYILQSTHSCVFDCTSLANCVTCTGSDCSTCSVGFYPDPSSPNCLACSAITSCSTCSQTAVTCFTCLTTAYLNGNTCPSCASLANCATCDGTSAGCIICSTGFYPDPAGFGCLSCSSLNCQTCSSSTGQCTLCNAGYYPDPLTIGCLACSNIIGCTTCSQTAVECTACVAYYYLDSLTCTACSTIPNCVDCLSVGIECTQCSVGYYPDPVLTGCLSCSAISQCLECDNTGVSQCTKCNVGYYPDPSTDGCLSCDQQANCVNCEQVGEICTQCQDGYYPDVNGDCQVCATITTDCLSCSPTSEECTQCAFGYFPDPLGSGCILCTTINFCEQCSQTAKLCTLCQVGYHVSSSGGCTLFTSCAAGYFLDASDNCIKCQTDGCVDCSAADTCIECTNGRFLVGTGSTATCDFCPVECTTCMSASVCTQCDSGYYLDGTSCLVCSSNCQNCLSDTACLSCPNGLYLDGTSCSLCESQITNCLTCAVDPLDSATILCESCVTGMYFDGATCQPCQDGCFSCSSATDCFSCELGMYFNADPGHNQCQKCQPQCSTCDDPVTCRSCKSGYLLDSTSCVPCPDDHCVSCSTTQCRACEPGYYLDNNNKCIDCSEGVTHCAVCASDSECFSCKVGYLLSANGLTCQPCSKSIDGCYFCTDNGASTDCHNCLTGYKYNGATCDRCSQGCRSCNDTNCFTCESKYYRTADPPLCRLCSLDFPRCETCDVNRCKTCQRGYYEDGGNCISCSIPMAGCRSCRDDLNCRACQTGFHLALVGVNRVCLRCSEIQGCVDCKSSQVCLLCEKDYILSESICKLCIQEVPDCIQCDKNGKCARCQAGFYINQLTQCSPCDLNNTGCIYCLDNATCYQCEVGYSLGGTNLCQPCADECETCSESDPTYCLTCDSQYFLKVAGDCETCKSEIKGCVECEAINKCIACDPDHYLDSSDRCSLCWSDITGCRRCTDEKTCHACEPSFYLNYTTHKCQLCENSLVGCKFCSANTTCIACQTGYYLENEQCILCSQMSGCRYCYDYGNCSVCELAYYLHDGLCRKCEVSMEGCTSCLSQIQCMSCIRHYKLNEHGFCQRIPIDTSKNPAIKLTTLYVSKTKLVHKLQAMEFKFNKKADLNAVKWSQEAQIRLVAQDGSIFDLKIESAEWSSNETLLIYTDNPINSLIDTEYKKMPFVRRLLDQDTNLLNVMTDLHFSRDLKDELMPEYDTFGPLALSFSLGEPEFYTSITENTVYMDSSYLFIIGLTITVIIFIKYCIKAVKTVPQSLNQGYIIPHIFAIKSGALVLYPTFNEYIDYCYGYMSADLPWLNGFFGPMFGLEGDYSPYPFKMYFTNMNIGSTYFLCTCLLIILVTMINILRNYHFKEQANNFARFLYSFFIFGVIFAGCVSLQGAIMNPTNTPSLNGFFYIIGIGIFLASVTHAITQIYSNYKSQFWRIRVLTKAILLSVTHFSPVPFLAATFFIDLVLMACQYYFTEYPKIFKKSWIAANLALNIAIVIVVFVPMVLIALLIVTLLVITALVCEIYMHHYQRLNRGKKIGPHPHTSNTIVFEDNTGQNSQIISDPNKGNKLLTNKKMFAHRKNITKKKQLYFYEETEDPQNEKNFQMIFNIEEDKDE